MPMIGGKLRTIPKAKSLRKRLEKRARKARREGLLIDRVPLNGRQIKKRIDREAHS